MSSDGDVTCQHPLLYGLKVNLTPILVKNQGAQVLAESGYNVRQNPYTQGPKNPDYLIDGEIFDAYSPSTSSVRNIADNMATKISSGQANNLVVNLTDSSVSVDALQAQLRQYPVPGLNKVLVIDQKGNIFQMKVGGN
jgi:filamentous hemagglutinin